MARPRKNTKSTESSSSKMPIAYFLSLEVENVLCFKDCQELKLTDNNGNPAQWTVILGDNGVGKTTLLRCLAGMSVNPSYYNKNYSNDIDIENISPIFNDYS